MNRKKNLTVPISDSDSFSGRFRLCLPDGVTLPLAAKSIGVSLSGMKKWLAGTSEPSLSYLPKISAFTKASVEWLATGTPQTTRDCEVQLQIDEGALAKLRARESAATDFDGLKKIKEEIVLLQKYLAASEEMLRLLRHRDKLKDVPLVNLSGLEANLTSHQPSGRLAENRRLQPVDQKLMGRCSDAFGKLYKELGVNLSLDDLGQMSAEAYNDVMAVTEDKSEQGIIIKGLVARHRREILTETTANTSGKRTAL